MTRFEQGSSVQGMTRDVRLDAAKGVLIFLVVFGHLIEPVRGEGWGMHVYRFIYLFHMPAFIFISGMLTSHRLDGDHAAKLVSRLLVPLLVFECLDLLVHYLARGTLPANVHNLQPAWTLWFFVSLMVWRLSAPALLRLRHPVAASVVLALLGLAAEPTGTYLTLGRTFSFLPFFVVGLVHGRDIVAAVQRRSTWSWAVAALAVLVLLLLAADHFPRRMLFGDSSFARQGLSLGQGAALRMGVWLLSMLAIVALLRLLPASRWLAGWGRRSLVIYVWHAPLLIILREAVDWQSLTRHPTPLFLGLFVLGGVLCLLLSSDLAHRLTEALLNPVRRMILPPYRVTGVQG